MRTTSGQKNPHEDDSVVSPAVDKDAIPVDDKEREVVDQPSKSLPILISGSTHAETLVPPHEDTAVEPPLMMKAISTLGISMPLMRFYPPVLLLVWKFQLFLALRCKGCREGILRLRLTLLPQHRFRPSKCLPTFSPRFRLF